MDALRATLAVFLVISLLPAVALVLVSAYASDSHQPGRVAKN